jgi:predicted nuclease of predicted toxin-antitoxin system
LARAVEKMSAIRAVYVGDMAEIRGHDDDTVMDYAKNDDRIVLTTEKRFERYKVCTNPGIIILTVREKHEFIRKRVFQKFLRSGHRKLVKDSLTRLAQQEAAITDHSGTSKIYKF